MNSASNGSDDNDAERGVRAIDDALLLSWPLPAPAAAGDKEQRGCVVIVAGGSETAGAAVLAGVAALRAGAGKLVIATARSIAPWVSVAVPESRVIGLTETPEGAFSLRGADRLIEAAHAADVLLVGPGMLCETGTATFVSALLANLDKVPVVLDAMAINALPALRHRPGLVITPHAGEMAHLTGATKEAILTDPFAVAKRAAHRWNTVVALKGALTWVVTPQAKAWRHARSNPGLATSGSGDVLAGLIAGFAARGAGIEQATCWGVAMHAASGRRAAERFGRLGFLARELATEVPPAMHEFLAPM